MQRAPLRVVEWEPTTPGKYVGPLLRCWVYVYLMDFQDPSAWDGSIDVTVQMELIPTVPVKVNYPIC